MSDAAPPEGAAPAAKPEKGGGLSKLVPVLLLVNLGATGFLVWKTLTAKPAAAAPAEAKKEEDAKGGGVKGPVAALDPFVVNLDEQGNPRYLKLTLQLEMANEEGIAALEKDKQPVRDAVLGFLSGLKVADTLGEANKQKIRDGILARVGDAVGKENVRKAYFSEFMVQ